MTATQTRLREIDLEPNRAANPQSKKGIALISVFGMKFLCYQGRSSDFAKETITGAGLKRIIAAVLSRKRTTQEFTVNGLGWVRADVYMPRRYSVIVKKGRNAGVEIGCVSLSLSRARWLLEPCLRG